MVALVLVTITIVSRVVGLEVPIEKFFRLGCLVVSRRPEPLITVINKHETLLV